MLPGGLASSDAVMEAVAETIAAHGGPSAFKFGVISHISSIPAVVLPVARFCGALPGVPVLVDGAHAPGNIDQLDIPSLGCGG